MVVSNLTVGARYVVRFQMTRRPGFPVNPLYVVIAGQSLGTHTPAANAWQQVETVAFTASGSATTLSFAGQSAGDTATAIDAVQVVPAGSAAGIAASASFESPTVNSHGYGASVSSAGVTFAGSAGIAANGGAFNFPATADGNQAGFLQASPSGAAGSIGETVSGLTAGVSYRVVFKAVSRPGYAQARLQVSAGGAMLLDTAAPTSWSSLTSAAFTATGASMTIGFQGVQVGSGDTATAIDAIQVLPQ